MHFVRSNNVPLNCVADSKQGGRPENQDDYGFLDTPLGFMFIICDGMGGGPGGKTASYIAKNEIAKALMGCSPQMPRDKAMKMAAAHAQEAIQNSMAKNPALQGMGSTFVAILVNGNSAFVAHAGDSRCYQLRGKRVVYRTTDHSLVAELVKKRVLSEEQARTSPQSNVISRGLGNMSNHTPDVVELPYKKGDRFVLCTDGAWGSMPNKDFINRLTSNIDRQALLTNLSNEIDRIGNQKGGFHDNHTIGIVDMEINSVLRASKDTWVKCGLLSVASLLSLALLVFVAIKACEGASNFFADNNQHSTPSIGGNGSAVNPFGNQASPQRKKQWERNGVDSEGSGSIMNVDSLVNIIQGDNKDTNTICKPALMVKNATTDTVWGTKTMSQSEVPVVEADSDTAKKDSTKVLIEIDDVKEEAKVFIQKSINRLKKMLSATYYNLEESKKEQEKLWSDYMRHLNELNKLELPQKVEEELKAITEISEDKEYSTKAKAVWKDENRNNCYCRAPGAEKNIEKLKTDLLKLKENFK